MPGIDHDRALKALDGDVELLRDLARMFVEDAPILLEKLKKAVDENDSKLVRSVAHTLKGLIATYFAKTGVDIAQRLEDAAADGELDPFFIGDLNRLEEFVGSMMVECEALGWVGQHRPIGYLANPSDAIGR